MATKKVKEASSKAQPAGKSDGLKVIVRQIRSEIGRDDRVRDTLRALGLGRIGKESEQVLSASVSGMISRVKSIVRVRKA